MTTLTIHHHRPARLIGGAAVVLAVAGGATALAVAHDSSTPGAPQEVSQTTGHQVTKRAGHVPPATTEPNRRGGRVMDGV